MNALEEFRSTLPVWRAEALSLRIAESAEDWN